VSHGFGVDSAVFDDDNLVSCAGLVPVMALAEQSGLSDLLAQRVRIVESKVKSGAANPAPKLATLVAGMCAGADSIDDVDVVRSGGMKTLFDQVYAPSTIGTPLREFSFGHARQLESVLRETGQLRHATEQRSGILIGADQRRLSGERHRTRRPQHRRRSNRVPKVIGEGSVSAASRTYLLPNVTQVLVHLPERFPECRQPFGELLGGRVLGSSRDFTELVARRRRPRGCITHERRPYPPAPTK
jgi:hypothetical protein